MRCALKQIMENNPLFYYSMQLCVSFEQKKKRKRTEDKLTGFLPGLQKLIYKLFSFQNTQSQNREPLKPPRESTDQETSEHKADGTCGQCVLLFTDTWGTLLGLNLWKIRPTHETPNTGKKLAGAGAF